MAQIFQDQNLSGQKKSYISQYCVTIIGQYLKDIFEIEKKYGLAFVSEETKKATLFKESVARTTQVKNKGINHELESFREAEFWQVITDHTVSIQTTIEALQILITSLEVQEDLKEHFSSSFSTSVDLSGLTLEDRKLQELVGCDMPYCFNLGSLFGNIAISHMHLGNYDKAEDFFKKSMEYFDDNKNAERLGINLSKYFVLPFKIRNEEQHLDVVPRLLESDSQIIISYSDEINYAFEKNTLTDLGGKDVIIIPHRNEDLIAKRTIAFNYSLYMHSQGRYEEELQLLQIAKSLEIEFDGKPKLNTISNIVSILHKLGRNDNALKELEKINPENYQGEEKIRALYSLYESLNFEDKNGKKGGTILDEMSYLMSSQSEIKDKELLFLIPYEKALYYSYQECKSSIEKAKILLEEARVRFFENEGFIKNVMGNKFFKDQMLLFVAEIIIFIKDHQYNPKTHEECQAIAKRIMDFNHKSSDLSEPISKSLVESFIEFIFQTYPRGVDLQTWNILQALRESYDIRSPFEDAIIQSYKKIRKPITSSDIEIEIKGDFDFDQIASYLKASFNIDETAITPPESEHDKVFMISLNKEAMELLDKKISTKVNPSNILSPRSEEKFLSVQNNTTLIS